MAARSTIVAVALAALGASACALVLGLEDRQLAANDDGGGDESSVSDDASDAQDANLDASATCSPDADFTDDPNNCGRCAHGCLGGECKGSVCQPVTLTTSIVNPTAVAALGSDVYWIETGDAYLDGGFPPNAVWKMPKTGGAATRIFAADAGPGYVDSLASGDTIYFSTETSSGDALVQTLKGVYCTISGAAYVDSMWARPDGIVYVGRRSSIGWSTCFPDGGMTDNPTISTFGAVRQLGDTLLVSMGSGVPLQPSHIWCCDGVFAGDASTCDMGFGTTPGALATGTIALAPERAYWSGGSALFWRPTDPDASLAAVQTPIDASALALESDAVGDVFLAVTSDTGGPGALVRFTCDDTGCHDETTIAIDYPTALASDDEGIYMAVARPLPDGGTTGAIIVLAKP